MGTVVSVVNHDRHECRSKPKPFFEFKSSWMPCTADPWMEASQRDCAGKPPWQLVCWNSSHVPHVPYPCHYTRTAETHPIQAKVDRNTKKCISNFKCRNMVRCNKLPKTLAMLVILQTCPAKRELKRFRCSAPQDLRITNESESFQLNSRTFRLVKFAISRTVQKACRKFAECVDKTWRKSSAVH